MELNEHVFLEELLGLRRESCWETTIPMANGMNEFFPNGFSFDCFNQNPVAFLPTNSSFQQGYSVPLEQSFDDSSYGEVYYPFISNEICAPQTLVDTSSFPVHEDHSFSVIEDDEQCLVGDDHPHNLDIHNTNASTTSTIASTTCKVEPVQSFEAPLLSNNMGSLCVERKNRVKKLEGQPSKNLMAERRRRKRLNDRLSMLRSVVPKISKMDRTSILGDTIEYMKELLERINNLQEEIDVGSNQLNLMGIFKDIKPNEVLVRNSPKFEVERRNMDTRIEICCAAKPGLLLSTVNTLEALGLEIQQCVISCFNDFAMQASCSEELEQRTINSEDIKQALFRNAGYGGRCM
ncbi:Myc-type, basic helix-loop-helix (bHLH) domain [Dillenia turbinata]|uniref:Myc-type, basic helix-loop-helix (BHLH) domain n=1 Tax=Dillenia turbinata TaxID=194707 RepID=A0AAN8VUJ5_9MAGN